MEVDEKTRTPKYTLDELLLDKGAEIELASTDEVLDAFRAMQGISGAVRIRNMDNTDDN